MHQLPPIRDEYKFELLIRDVLRKKYQEPNLELYGRRRQEQHGIDGYHLHNSKVIAFQCKKRDITSRPDREIANELMRAFSNDARNANEFFSEQGLEVETYYFATTFKNDTRLQDKAMELSEELKFAVEYLSWDSITEYVIADQELLKEYFSEFLIEVNKNAENYVKYITQDDTKDNIIDSQDALLDLSLDYYMVNDNANVVFRVICNNIDIPNEGIIDRATNTIDSISPNSAFWILGEGGTGKTTILFRLAIQYVQRGRRVFLLDFENTSFDSDKITELLWYIKMKSGDNHSYIFVDNPDFDHTALENLLRSLSDSGLNFTLILTERINRFEFIKKENVQYNINPQDFIEPLKIINSRSYRNKIYNKLYKLLGRDDSNIRLIIDEFIGKIELGLVETTYKILYKLRKKRYIDYIFDWIEYRSIAEDHFPSLVDAYKYIAIFYLFGIKLPFSILEKLCNPTKIEKDKFFNSFSKKSREPIIVFKRETRHFEYKYYLRTKHEVISELYFDESEIIKDEVVAEIIKVFDPQNYDETQILVQLFGNKRNIAGKATNFEKLIDYMLSEKLLEKTSVNTKLYLTVLLSKFWIYKYNNRTDEAVIYLEKLAKEFPDDLHYRTELSKIYQSQGKLAEAEEVLLESLEIDNKQLHPRTELSKIYQSQGK
ncbi:MAG: hypothetical protein GY839_01435, partial [candidate division Zixibacteria bacterium]|nr:hypothetical protein [candidate division Zixibacteria bacterium]